MTINYKSFPVGPLQCNCTIIGNTSTGKGYLIDPGGDAERILETIETMNVSIEAIYHTHAHFDHFLASAEIKEKTGAPIFLNESDRFLWDTLEMQCSYFNIDFKPTPPPDFNIEDQQDLIHCAGVCIHTPGHTPGSVSFHFESEKLLIAGDTLFQGSVGRTDLPGGDFKMLKSSIQEKIYSLDESTVVVTGHGPQTSIKKEMESNLFIRYDT
ncbi:MAG TPA: MBL fold metallo-hydrolase [Gammaproteobacteria bacterium]|jgi:glyoxylase-like metal-dependent hydrolase (beta-lactamase superfamily II)|nr:MBL fold metallo-hydrolase [Gammaproteobacteria bacterium]